MQNQQQELQSQLASMRNLKTQIWLLASALNNRPPTRLPNDIQVPRQEGTKECKAVELISGKELPDPYNATEFENKQEKEG